MRTRVSALGLCALLACSGNADPTPLAFAGAATACERLDWAREHAGLLESDADEARRFAGDRCFSVEISRPILVVEGPTGALLPGRGWVRVATLDGEPLEHHASAELRRTLGLEPRTEGWVRRSELVEGS